MNTPFLFLFDTTTTLCSVAISKGNTIIALKEYDGEFKHAELLSIFIEDVLKQAGISLKDVDAFVLSKGPGSYTGLRIGTSLIKGICYALQKPLIAINTLQAMAHAVSLENKLSGNYCAMIDARRMEVYAHIVNEHGNEVRETKADIIDTTSYLNLMDKPFYYFGDGAQKCVETLSINSNAKYIPNVTCKASNMLPLALKAFEQKQFEDVAYFEPFYLKEFMIGKK